MYLTKLWLRQFDGGAGAAGGTGGAAPAAAGGAIGDTGSGEANGAQTQDHKTRKSSRRGKSGALDNVVYGKQPEPEVKTPDAEGKAKTENPDQTTKPEANTAAQTDAQKEADRRKAFNERINGEDKDLYGENVQNIINKRFKEAKGAQEFQQNATPLLETLAQKYGVDGADLQALTKAVQGDSAMWQEAADKAGMSVDQFREQTKLTNENKALNAQLQQRAKIDQSQKRLNGWRQEGEALKATYPDFNIDTEGNNSTFTRLLSNGFPVKDAYEAAHHTELTAKAAQAAQQQTVQNIQARGNRPAENGANSQAGMVYKQSAKNLTREDRAEIRRRTSRGEKISFV